MMCRQKSCKHCQPVNELSGACDVEEDVCFEPVDEDQRQAPGTWLACDQYERQA